jgi:dihydrodipicolinate synthase/N-acetylneuraminate lyase
VKTSRVTKADLAASVFAVPPLARHGELGLNPEANAAVIRHIEAGGVTSLVYGGNANFYGIGMYEYPALLDMLEQAAGPQTWVLPSAGPDFGKLMDQAAVLRARRFPAVMVLPMMFPSAPDGVAKGLRLFAQASATPLILYVKAEHLISLEDIGRLVDDGLVCGIKYAITRDAPLDDEFLTRLLDRVDRSLVVSGMAEIPAVDHLRALGMPAYTSGGVCIAPRLATRLLRSAQAGDFAEAERCREHFLPLERLRQRADAFAVLHEALTLSGIAEMGPQLPMLGELALAERQALIPIVAALMAAEAATPAATSATAPAAVSAAA